MPADPPLPAPAPPPSAAALVGLRERREQVIALLSQQYSEDTLDLEELERRMDLAHGAPSVAALDALVSDLAPAAGASGALAGRPVDAAALARWPARKKLTAIFGGIEKHGRWVCPRHVQIVAVFGGADLDLREAELAPGVTELRITAVFGGVDLIVPPWVTVECDATALFGAFEEIHRAPPSADPDRRVLRITGTAVFGGVEIHTRLPGESRRDARRRNKREAKALEGEARAALPEARAIIREKE